MLIQWLTRKSIGPERIGQLRFYNNAKADKFMEVLGGGPSSVLASGASATLVGKGNLCRVFGTAGTDLVVFGPDNTLAAPTTSTQNAVMLSQSCMIIVATDEFIRTTAGVTRIEIFQE